MNGFYPRQRYNADGSLQHQQYTPQHQAHDLGQDASMIDMTGSGTGYGGIPGATSLDDIVSQNAKDMRRRRRSMPVPYQQSPQHNMNQSTNDLDDSMRRASMVDMMDFTTGNADLANFNFDASAFDAGMLDMSSGAAGRGAGGLSVNTQFPAQYGPSNQPQSGFDSAMSGGNGFDASLNSPYLTSAFPTVSMGNDMNMMGGDVSTAPNMFSTDQFNASMTNSPIATNAYTPSMLGPNTLQDPGGGGGSGGGGGTLSGRTSRTPNTNTTGTPITPSIRQPSTRTNSHENDSRGASRHGSVSTQPRPQPQVQHQHQQVSASSITGQSASSGGFSTSTTTNNTHDKIVSQPNEVPEMINGNPLPWSAPQGGWPSSITGRTHMKTEQFKDVYAPSGYDLMSILIKVANRPNPQINIGAVDLSCAFVVCNTKVHDSPIEYASESFERLTGYTRHEIIGQNCRFLQSPDARVTPGIKRKYCDDDAVLYLKNCITTQSEAQISLINYRKGGQPFMNLLTMIPILDEMGETTHFVGFQVDLVENPTAINARNPDGTYSINYQRHESLPSYFLNAPGVPALSEVSQTLPRDEVSTVLGTIAGAGENELSRRLMDKVLLENADDVIHVLSLKGLFLYLSPSSRKVLEYDPAELVGTPLSSVCHPSDIVPVTRELKDPSAGSSISVVFRIRRKNSGYMWFESHGSLHTEQGKGRKCIILVGRERPVYTLTKAALTEGGGIGENELWTKMSTTGMFLFVSSNVRQLLDRQPEDMVGTNIQSLMRPDSKDEFGRVLTIALTGKNTSVRHEMTNKRGQVLQAFSWIYPGDATEGNKPTFLVVQIRLIRYHRGGGQRHTTGSISGATPSGQQPSKTDLLTRTSLNANANEVGDTTPFTNTSNSNAASMDSAFYHGDKSFAVTHAGAAGLSIGRQDASLASEDNVFDELKTVRSSSWQFELRQMEKRNRLLAEEVQTLIAAKKKRKRRRGAGSLQKDCANCHTKSTPEWRRGPSGQRDLCNSCGLRWAKQDKNGRVSPRTSSQHSVKSAHSDKASKASASPLSDQVQIGDQPSIASLTATPSLVDGAPTASAAEKRINAQEASMESHNAKVARMEAAPDAGLGMGGGIPGTIVEEGNQFEG